MKEKFIKIKKIHPIGILTMHTNIVDQINDYDAYLDVLSEIALIVHDPDKECWNDIHECILQLHNRFGSDIDIEILEPDLIPNFAGIPLPYINSNFN